MNMTVLAIGDVVGRPGRRALQEALPLLRQKFNPDIHILNGENASGGFGLTRKEYDQFVEEFGFDAITLGNHWQDKKEIINWYHKASRLVVPANAYNNDDEQKGLKILKTQKNGEPFAVINLIGRAFMHPQNRNPFETAAKLLNHIPSNVLIRLVDIHAEATSEKQAMGYFLRKKVSLVYGTHSHVPTADERILDGHTGFLTDLGATGSYDSIIGMDRKIALARFLSNEKKPWQVAKKNLWVCGVIARVNKSTGACFELLRFQIRENTWQIDPCARL